jgi:geranylgeranyl diphosphate synthase type II
MDFSSYWSARQKKVDAALNRLLPSATTKPKTIHRAMRYSIFAGGKRLRPIICLATAEVLSGKNDDAIPLACAVECIHTYSLIHFAQSFRRRRCRACGRCPPDDCF